MNSDMPTFASGMIVPCPLLPKCNITHQHIVENINSSMQTFKNKRPFLQLNLAELLCNYKFDVWIKVKNNLLTHP